MTLNGDVPKTRASKFMRKKLEELQGEQINSPLQFETSTLLYQKWISSSREKIIKDIVELNKTINQLEIIGIYRILHLTTAEYTLFLSSHKAVTKIEHILCHVIHVNKFKRIKIINCLFSHHDGIKLEINNKKIGGKSLDTQRLSNSYN